MAPGPEGHLGALRALSLITLLQAIPFLPLNLLSFLLSTKQLGKGMGPGKEPQGGEFGVPVSGPGSDLPSPGTLFKSTSLFSSLSSWSVSSRYAFSTVALM